MARTEKCALLFFLVILLGICASCSSTSTTQVSSPTGRTPKTLYVDAAIGNNANTGTSGQPFKTITHALAQVLSGDTVSVATGTYDSILGEIFPITVPQGVTLSGDSANRGSGAFPTVIQGRGTIASAPTTSAAVIASQDSTITGFTISNGIGTGLNYGIYVNTSGVTVEANTFTITPQGVHLDTAASAVVQNNTFQTAVYGILTIGTGTIQNNTFSSAFYGVDNQGGNSSIRDNAFLDLSSLGIFVQFGSPRIENNTFTAASYGSGGALNVRNTATPRVRGNTFTLTTGPAVVINHNAAPDLGMASDLGSNTFTITNGADVHHNSSSTVNAIGNTWSVPSPLCGQHIVTTSTGTVVYGTGASDTCP